MVKCVRKKCKRVEEQMQLSNCHTERTKHVRKQLESRSAMATFQLSERAHELSEVKQKVTF